jgi:hypothetical protein
MDLIFWLRASWVNTPRRFFRFFDMSIFGPFRALFRSFSGFFLFILSNSSVRATSRYDRLTNLIFDTESLYDTITWGFQRFLKFLPLLGALLFSKRALKAKRHKCGHRDIISWYSGSM